MLTTDNWLTIVGFIAMGILYVADSRASSKTFAIRLDFVDAQMEDSKLELKKLNGVLVQLAEQSGRMDRIEDRQLAEGKRVDAFEQRFNRYVNGVHKGD